MLDKIDKLKRFLNERRKWLELDKPYRAEEKIKEIFEICKSCPEFNKKSEEEGNCNICGCRLTPNKEYMNKAAWSTTFCPLDEPKWLPEPEYQNMKEEVLLEQTEIIKAEEVKNEEPPPKRRRNCGCGGG